MTVSFLINHLWQSSCFVLLAGLVALALRNNSPKIRYWVWLSASLKFLLPFALLVGVGNLIPRSAPKPVLGSAPVFLDVIVQVAQPFSADSSVSVPVSNPLDWAPLIIGFIWAFGFLGITLARWRGWLRIRAALRNGVPVELPVPIRALIVSGAAEPGIAGFLRPVLVLPGQLLERLSPAQLGAILTHEMCHVHRRDNLFAVFHMAVEALFWFHPLVWWIGSRLVEEREQACDEEVLRMGFEPNDYVHAILTVCRQYAESPLPCVSGVTGGGIKKRVRMILEGAVAGELSVGKRAILATLGAAVLAVPILIGTLNTPAMGAQEAPLALPQFEVASIKSTDRRGGGMMRPMPGRLTASAPLAVLMQAAYRVQPFQIVGGPEWVRSDQYVIDGKASGNPEHRQLMLMLQSLLADRFQLRFHRESRQMPAYALMPAPGGIKLSPPRDGSCTEVEAPPPGAGDPPPKPRCGGTDVGLESEGWRMRGGKVPMAEFVRKLALMLGRPVADQTGFSGVFDVDLPFRADEAIAGFPPPPDGAVSAEAGSPSIFNAVQQLGLRLQAVKGPADVLVIDRVARPSEN